MAKKVEIKTVISADDQTQSSIKSATAGFEKFSKTAGLSGASSKNSFQKIANASKPLAQNIQKANGAVSGLNKAIVGLAIFKGVSMVKNMTTAHLASSDTLAKNSIAVGLSVESLQALNYVSERQGVSTQALYTHLKKFSGELGRAREGQGTLYNELKRTNPELLKQLQNAKNNEEAFLIASEAIDKLGDASQKSALNQKIFGRGGVELNKMFVGGAEAMKALMKEKLKYGVVTTAQAQQAESVQDELTKLATAGQGLANTLMGALIPSILKVAESLNKFISNNQGLIQGIAQLLAKLLPLAPVILGIVGAFKLFRFVTVTLPLIFGAISTIMPFMIGLFNGTTASVWGMNAAFLANPVVLIVVGIIAAIAAVIVVIVVLYKRFEAVRNVIQAIGRGLRDFFMPIITIISNLFGGIVNSVKKIFSFIGRKKKVSAELEAPKVESTPLQAQKQENVLAGMHNENRSQTTIDVNFQNLPQGVIVNQSPPVAGITLNLGYSG